MNPTYLELAYNGNFVCRSNVAEYFTYQGRVFAAMPTKHGEIVVCETTGEYLF